jgi:hypothetical protein
MADTYTIIVKNQSGASNKVYNIASEAPTVNGGGVTGVHNVMWHKTRVLPAGDKAIFKYTPTYYATIGYTTPFSNKLKANDEVEGQGFIVLNIGTEVDNSSVILVDNSFGIKEANSTFTMNQFQVMTQTLIPTPNHYAVGLARQQVGEDSPAPVAVVELKPNVKYTFEPKAGVLIKAANVVEAGAIFDAPTDAQINAKTVAKVNFVKPYTKATVTEKSDGTFGVEYS